MAAAGDEAKQPARVDLRSLEEELAFIEQSSPVSWRVKKGFVPGMRVEGSFYVSDKLHGLMVDELEQYVTRQVAAIAAAGNGAGPRSGGGFLPAVKQLANVASLPGIVTRSIALPGACAGSAAIAIARPRRCPPRADGTGGGTDGAGRDRTGRTQTCTRATASPSATSPPST